jgi:hypothetical protein
MGSEFVEPRAIATSMRKGKKDIGDGGMRILLVVVPVSKGPAVMARPERLSQNNITDM